MWIFFIPFILLLNVIEGKYRYPVKQAGRRRGEDSVTPKEKTEEN
jgi:hypothetical protein